MSLSAQQKLWVAVLRTGNYVQTRTKYAYLSEADGYTALGVLCELAKHAGVITDYNPMQDVPIPVQRWIGLRVPYRASVSLADDSIGFLQMATLIETHAADLFE